MRTFLINLDRSVDRLEIAKNRAEEAGVSFERFAGVDGKELSPSRKRQETGRIRSWLAKGGLNDGEIGCALSHIYIYKKMVEEAIPIALVLEDDVLYLGDVKKAIKVVEDFVDVERPQVFQLTYIVDGERVLVTDQEKCFPISGGMFTSSYIITLAAASALIRQNYPVIMPADAWARWVRLRAIEFYQVFPAVFGQWSDNSLVREPGERLRYEHIMGRVLHKCKRLIGWPCDRVLSMITGR